MQWQIGDVLVTWLQNVDIKSSIEAQKDILAWIFV